MTRSLFAHILLLATVYGLSLSISSAFVVPTRPILALTVSPVLIWLSIHDLEHNEIPDTATLFIALAGGIDLWLRHGPTLPFFTDVAASALMVVSLWTLGELYFRRTGIEALGIGDAKLIGAGTLCLGAAAIWLMLFLAATGGIVAALLSNSRGKPRRGIAFGPFLAYAIFILLIIPTGRLYWQ